MHGSLDVVLGIAGGLALASVETRVTTILTSVLFFVFWISYLLHGRLLSPLGSLEQQSIQRSLPDRFINSEMIAPHDKRDHTYVLFALDIQRSASRRLVRFGEGVENCNNTLMTTAKTFASLLITLFVAHTRSSPFRTASRSCSMYLPTRRPGQMGKRTYEYPSSKKKKKYPCFAIKTTL